MFWKVISLAFSKHLPDAVDCVIFVVKLLHQRKAAKRDGKFSQKEKIELFDRQEIALEKIYKVFKK